MTVHVLMILDASGSMSPLADDVRKGVNGYLDGLEGDYKVTMTRFNTDVTRLCESMSPQEAPRLGKHNYFPGGFTALFDAFVMTIEKFEVPEGDKVIVFTQTDGHENSSIEHSFDDVTGLISAKENQEWAFIFAGVGPSGFDQMHSLSGRWSKASSGSARGMSASYGGLAAASTYYATPGASAQGAYDTYVVEVEENDKT